MTTKKTDAKPTAAEIEAQKAAETAEREAAQAEAAKKAVAAGIKPLKAVHLIDGGDEFGGASPNSFFIPQSDAQRADLLKLEAAVELTEVELALAEKIGVRPLGLTAGAFAAQQADI